MAKINNSKSFKTANNLFNMGGRLIPCKVKKVILDPYTNLAAAYGGHDSVGLIFYNKIRKRITGLGMKNVDSKEREENIQYDGFAKPLFPFLKYYPLVNEVVTVITLTSKDYLEDRTNISDYYFPPINLWNHPHHNTLPAVQNYKEDKSEIFKQGDYGYEGLVRRTTDGEVDLNIPLGNYFKEYLNIKPLLPYEGDHITEGRFGNSIRLGATARGVEKDKETGREKYEFPTASLSPWSKGGASTNGDPITIIRNGQPSELDDQGWVHTIEDINLDPSSIYLTSTQNIENFQVAAPMCWYSFGLNVELKQEPNKEASKMLSNTSDFVTAGEEGSSEVEEKKTKIDKSKECPEGQVWDETIQKCVLPTVEVTGTAESPEIAEEEITESISEEEAGMVDEEKQPEQYQEDNELQEEVEYVDPNLPPSYQYADDSSEDSPVGYGEQCQLCVHFESWSSKKCNKWNAVVKYDFWCESFKEKPPWARFIGKYYKGYGIGEEYSEAEHEAKQDALYDIHNDILENGGENRNYNIVLGESFQFSTPTRMQDGNLSVVMSYKVISIN